MKYHTLKWFENRIGKKIYRLTNRKCCHHCSETYLNGLIVMDKQHAEYLYACQAEMQVEDADTKREV